MKYFKFIILSLSFLTLGLVTLQAQSGGKKAKKETVSIQTSANCGECKTIIESALAREKGVKNSDLNLDSKIVSVTFSPKKTSLAQIKKAISLAGYDADEVIADQEAHDNLPKCCKKGGMD